MIRGGKRRLRRVSMKDSKPTVCMHRYIGCHIPVVMYISQKSLQWSSKPQSHQNHRTNLDYHRISTVLSDAFTVSCETRAWLNAFFVVSMIYPSEGGDSQGKWFEAFLSSLNRSRRQGDITIDMLLSNANNNEWSRRILVSLQASTVDRLPFFLAETFCCRSYTYISTINTYSM